MNIDIDSFTEAELIDLNNRIAARLRMLRDMRAHVGMLEFKIGDRVSFHPSGDPVLRGTVTRYNRKTVTVVTDEGAHWNVSPALLQKLMATPGAASNVIDLTKRR